MTDILEFKGQYDFLSNFYPAVVRLDHNEYPTVEHAYQAAKTLDSKERRLIRVAPTPGTAKRLGRKATIRKDWKDIKIDIMDDLCWQKFEDPTLQAKLLAINGQIIEGNYWGDTFWGVCKGVGRNELGKILMNIRNEIRQTLRQK